MDKKFLNLQIKKRGDEYEKIIKTEKELPVDVLIAMAENRTVDVETTGRYLI